MLSAGARGCIAAVAAGVRALFRCALRALVRGLLRRAALISRRACMR